MATKIFHIELKVQAVDSVERMNELTSALRVAGRQLHAMAMLICGDGPAPEIELSGEDFVDGRTTIKMEDQ